ncbi:hypothetical protein HID58_026088 [Brassica napus]|uniref:Uncharacterized protein n=1 Tax=Brassica napus TaxID=3708 RepID=A0ABQ8CPD7_BRANA|nr:hypothetical protein HID58_026088 [Brassica napus]
MRASGVKVLNSHNQFSQLEILTFSLSFQVFLSSTTNSSALALSNLHGSITIMLELEAFRQIHLLNRSMIVLSTFDVAYVFGALHQKFLSINSPTSSYGCNNVELPHDFFYTVEHDSLLNGSIFNFL